MVSLDTAIDDYIVAVCLRYFRRNVFVSTNTPHVDAARDADFLRAHWALSREVRDLLSYVLSHLHEVQSLLGFRRRVFNAIPRGRVDARATLRERLTTGHPALVVAEEPVRSFNTGPNLLLVWIIKAAAMYAGRLMRIQAEESEHASLIKQVMGSIAAVKRVDCLREPLKRVSLRRRPSAAALQLASRTRRAVYRKAVSAYRTLSGIESGNDEALGRVLAGALCGPLEQWRRFELAVALGIGNALEKETGSEMHLSVLGKPDRAPILVCGTYELFWQGGGGQFTPPPLEPSEERLRRALSAYGIKLGHDRPDLVLVDQAKRSVCGIIEVKYSAGDSPTRSFREATATASEFS